MIKIRKDDTRGASDGDRRNDRRDSRDGNRSNERRESSAGRSDNRRSSYGDRSNDKRGGSYNDRGGDNRSSYGDRGDDRRSSYGDRDNNRRGGSYGDRPRRDDSRGPRKFDKRGGPRGGKRDFFGNKPAPRRDQDGNEEFVDKAAVVSQHRFNEISEIDNQVLGLLERRSALIRREGAWRKSRQKSLVDPHLEKQLRVAFDKQANDLGLDAKLTKQFFTLLNQFSLADVRKKFTGEGYKLAPRVEAASASIAGPRSFRMTRLWQAMAASAGAEISLAPVTLNAPNKDLAKALKQAKAPMSWDDDEIKAAKGTGLSFEGNMIFVGEDTFNFYLLLCLALGHAGRCKFTGKPALQLLDIASLNKVLPSLGARLVPMNPNNPGLPARLECGGAMDEAVTLPGSIDPDFAAALTLAAWSFPGGLTLKGLNAACRERVAEAVEVLNECGIKAELKKDVCTVKDGVPTIPAAPLLPLSIRLNSILLALPVFCGGRINIAGAWPKNEQADSVIAELTKLGLDISVATENIVATRKDNAPKEATIEIGSSEALYPLALALGLKVGDATLSGAVQDPALEILDKIGAAYEIGENEITLKAGSKTWDGTWFSPDPIWSTACALIAYTVPGIVLENHGEVTTTWPEFWNFYNSLPTGKMKPKPVKEEKDDKRRRIKVRS